LELAFAHEVPAVGAADRVVDEKWLEAVEDY